jgi:hypothetical protein
MRRHKGVIAVQAGGFYRGTMLARWMPAAVVQSNFASKSPTMELLFVSWDGQVLERTEVCTEHQNVSKTFPRRFRETFYERVWRRRRARTLSGNGSGNIADIV